MVKFVSKLLTLAVTMAVGGVGDVNGQLIYQPKPTLAWDGRVQSIRGGNGVFLSPDDEILVSSSNLGYVNAFDAATGAEIWAYVPITPDNDFISCKSGITFSTIGSLEYLVLSVIINESTNPMT